MEILVEGSRARRQTVTAQETVRLRAVPRSPGEKFDSVQWFVEGADRTTADGEEFSFKFKRGSNGATREACVVAVVRDGADVQRATSDRVEFVVKSIPGVTLAIAVTKNRVGNAKSLQDDKNFVNEANGLKHAVAGAITPEDLGMSVETRSAEQLLEALRRATKKHAFIKNVVIYGHGGHTAVVANDDVGLYATKEGFLSADYPSGTSPNRAGGARLVDDFIPELKNESIRFADDAVIQIVACECGVPFRTQKSIGHMLAEKLSVTVFAATGATTHTAQWNAVHSAGWKKFSQDSSGAVVSSFAGAKTIEMEGKGGKKVKQTVLDPRQNFATTR